MSVMVAIKKMKGGAEAPPAKRFHLSAERCGKLDRFPIPSPLSLGAEDDSRGRARQPRTERRWLMGPSSAT